MKKIFLLISLLLSLPVTAFSEEGAGQVMVTAAEGNPLILREGAEIPASVGTACMKGDKLKTAEGCQVDMVFNENAGARLLASTEAQLVSTSPADSYMEIKEGNALFNLKKLPEGSTFRVETPNAVAAVRGTRFWGRVDKKDPNNDIVTFAVAEGSVDIFAKSVNRSYHLEPKQALDIPRHVNESPKVREAKREELKAMKQAEEIATESVKA
jgi:hypothetical protein